MMPVHLQSCELVWLPKSWCLECKWLVKKKNEFKTQQYKSTEWMFVHHRHAWGSIFWMKYLCMRGKFSLKPEDDAASRRYCSTSWIKMATNFEKVSQWTRNLLILWWNEPYWCVKLLTTVIAALQLAHQEDLPSEFSKIMFNGYQQTTEWEVKKLRACLRKKAQITLLELQCLLLSIRNNTFRLNGPLKVSSECHLSGVINHLCWPDNASSKKLILPLNHGFNICIIKAENIFCKVSVKVWWYQNWILVIKWHKISLESSKINIQCISNL